MIWIILYFAAASVMFGISLCGDKSPDARNVVIGLLWPVILLAAIGYGMALWSKK